MDNAEKLQDVSENELDETTDDVQSNSELSNENNMKEEETNNAGESTENTEKLADNKAEEPSAKTPEVKEESSEKKEEEPSVSDEQEREVEASAETVGQEPKNKPSTESEDNVEAVESADEKVEETEKVESSEKSESEGDEEVEDEQEGDEHEEEEQEEEFDFDHADKNELLSKLREIRNEEDFKRLDKILKAIKPRFDELYELEKNEALQRFVSEGNEADAFEYHSDEGDKEFITLFGQLKSRRNKHYKDLQNQREDNLKKKERLLEQLREIVDGEESTQSINAVKELQNEWKKIGGVPGAQNKTLWANYNALLDRYYDARSIYFELKDLDRKKNMEMKLELCVKAEALNELEDLKVAIIQLNELHEEYKHIGPVPKDDQEPLWQRFKAASDAVYAQRKEYFEELKVQFEANLVKKEELIKEVESFLSFDSDRITEWNGKTKEILELQKRWEAVGGVPKEKAKETNRAFWNTFKKFFANKNQFFKKLEGQRDENLAKKQELIAKAEEIKESNEWDSAAQKLKNLQAEWKEIGPVPEKVRKETYGKFKAACDHFFNRRRDQNKEKFKEYDDNLELKLQICDQLEAIVEQDTINLDDVYDLVDNHTSIGFVPKNAIKKSRKRFEEVIGKILALEGLEEGDRMDLKNHVEFGRLRNSPGGNQKLQRKEHSIKRKISSLQNDISTWNTNMEFFAKSATADKLKADMQDKIDAAEKELENLKSQLSSI